MTAFIEVVSVSLACLIFVGVVGWVAGMLYLRLIVIVERNAHNRRRENNRQQFDAQQGPPFWLGDPPDGDTFP